MIAALVLALAVSSANSQAQAAFTRGLSFYYAYNGEAAVEQFDQAMASDPHFAMAAWGAVLALGPDVNTPMTQERFETAAQTVAPMLGLRQYAAPEEQQYIDAMALRYRGTWDDWRSDERAYRTAMIALADAHPTDVDAQVIAAEAALEDGGLAWNGKIPATTASQAALRLDERALAHDPQNLMANHLCIHLYDDAPDRKPAIDCAERLDTVVLQPEEEHLAHMPAHVWMESGLWRRALASSSRAWSLIEISAVQHGSPPSAAKYAAHDAWIGLLASTMGVDRSEAEIWGKRLAPAGNEIFEPLIAARFDDWNAMPAFDPKTTPDGYLVAGLAALNKHDVTTARLELRAVQAAHVDSDADLLESRIAEANGHVDIALAALKRLKTWEANNLTAEAVPMFPADEQIGALLFRAGRFSEAEGAFRAAVSNRPNAPRALFGLYQTLAQEGKADEASAVEVRYDVASSGDTKLSMADL